LVGGKTAEAVLVEALIFLLNCGHLWLIIFILNIYNREYKDWVNCQRDSLKNDKLLLNYMYNTNYY
jgi:hypothetical protein